MSVELRHERKLLAEGVSAREVEALVRLHPAHFHEANPPRRINSVYYDTPGMRAYRENLAGTGERTKVRLRWYGALLGPVIDPSVEVKTKHAAVGGKRRFPGLPFEMRPGIEASELTASLDAGARAPAEAHLLAGLRPVLLTTYARSYWLSRDGRCRLTVDADIAYLRIHPFGNDLRDRREDDRRVVVELKYALEDDESARWLVGELPIRLSRSSKYARGIELLYAVVS